MSESEIPTQPQHDQPFREFGRPMVLSFLSFEDGDCFDDDGVERVRFECHQDALEALLDSSILPHTKNVRLFLQTEQVFIPIAAYQRESVSEAELTRWSGLAVETLRDAFCEEYGDWDSGDDRLADADVSEMAGRMRELCEWYLSKARVFRVNKLRTWTFDSEDVLELVEQLRPEWLHENHATV